MRVGQAFEAAHPDESTYLVVYGIDQFILE